MWIGPLITALQNIHYTLLQVTESVSNQYFPTVKHFMEHYYTEIRGKRNHNFSKLNKIEILIPQTGTLHKVLLQEIEMIPNQFSAKLEHCIE